MPTTDHNHDNSVIGVAGPDRPDHNARPGTPECPPPAARAGAVVWLWARSFAVALALSFVALALASLAGYDLTPSDNPATSTDQPTTVVRHPVSALVRPIAQSTPLNPSPADHTQHSTATPPATAPSALPVTAPVTASSALPVSLPVSLTQTVRAGAAHAVKEVRGGDELEACRAGQTPRWTKLTPTGERDRNGRLLINAGPIDVAIDLDIAARRACPDHDTDRDRGRGRRSDRDRDADPTSSRDRDSDRDDCPCLYPRRDTPSDYRDRADTRPTNYNRDTRYDGPRRYDPRYRDSHDRRGSGEVCRSYAPGEHRQLPDGGLICTHPDSRDR